MSNERLVEPITVVDAETLALGQRSTVYHHVRELETREGKYRCLFRSPKSMQIINTRPVPVSKPNPGKL